MKSSETTAWRIVTILAIVQAGAYVGNEAATYFWDVTAYVAALDSVNPYRFEVPYPFLYPPAALDLFRLAKSHLFELLSIAEVAAAAWFLAAFARLNMPRKFEWLLAITAMGGLGVVSLQSGNVGLLLNFTLLGLVVRAATGDAMSLQLLPVAIGLGSLIKPQFALYLGLLLCLERSRATAVVKALAVGLAVAAVHGAYAVFRPDDWNEYVQAVLKRTTIEKDYGWGPAQFVQRFTASNGAALAGYIGGLLAAGGLSYATWRKSVRAGEPLPTAATVSLAFVVLTFANPRMPLYDLYASAIAMIICCGFASRTPVLPWVMALALSMNFAPWLIDNFARTPSAYPWWVRDLQITHLLGFGILLATLWRVATRDGGPSSDRSATPVAPAHSRR